MRQADQYQGDISHMQDVVELTMVHCTQPAKLQYELADTYQ